MPPQHMPTPYEVKRIGHDAYIEVASGRPKVRFVCDLNISRKETARFEATVAFIVRACNSYDDLLRACEAVMEVPGLGPLATVSIIDLLIAAIDKAKKGT